MTPQPRRRSFSGLGVTALVAALLASGSYVSLTVLAPLDPVTAQVITAPVIDTPEPVVNFPGYGGSAVAAIGYPDVVLSSGSAEPMQLASITKVITALVVLDANPISAGDPGPTITFGPWDVSRYRYHLNNNGSNEPVWNGLRLTQRETLETVMLSSANNYAESIAVWAFGSIPAFVDRANSWLASNGMPDTRIVEPSGLDARNVSTTIDLLTLGRLALADPTLSEMVAKANSRVTGIGAIENSNRLLGKDGIDGIKTGTLDYYNLLFSADLDLGDHTVTVVGSVLGAVSREVRDASVSLLVQSLRDGFEQRELVSEGTIVGSYETLWGQRANAVTARSASAFVWKGSDVASTIVLDDVRVGDPTQLVGRVEYRVGQRIVSVPILLDGEIDDPGVWWRLTNPELLLP